MSFQDILYRFYQANKIVYVISETHKGLKRVTVICLLLVNKADTGLCSSGAQWHLTFALGRLENLSFFIQIICWAP